MWNESFRAALTAWECGIQWCLCFFSCKATRDIPARSVIFIEPPLCVGPKWCLNDDDKCLPQFPCVGQFTVIHFIRIKSNNMNSLCIRLFQTNNTAWKLLPKVRRNSNESLKDLVQENRYFFLSTLLGACGQLVAVIVLAWLIHWCMVWNVSFCVDALDPADHQTFKISPISIVVMFC